MYDPYKDFVSVDLSNGMKLWKLQMDGPQWEKTRIVVHTGHSTDPVGKEGLAHFCEHLASEQYRGPQDSEILRRKFESFGGSVDFGVTTPEATYYDFSIPLSVHGIDTLLWALESFAEILTKPSRMTPDQIRHIEKERSIIVSEFHKKYFSSWSYPVFKTIREHLYPGLWQSRVTNGLGTLDTIANFTAHEVVQLYQESYVPTNMTIISVGGASVDRLTDALETVFRDMKPGAKTRPDTEFLKLSVVPKPLVAKIVVSVESQKQSDVEMFCLIPRTIPWSVGLVLKGMLQRALYEDIREAQHLAYSVGVNQQRYSNVTQLTMIAKAVDPVSVEKVEKAFRDALVRVQTDKDLFTDEYNSHLASYAMLDVSGGSMRSNAFENVVRSGTITSNQADFDEFSSLTHETVALFVGEWLQPRRTYTVVYQP